MEQEQWLQLKMLFSLGYNLKIVIHWGRDWLLVGRGGQGGIKIDWGIDFLGGGMGEFLAGRGDSPHPPNRENPVLITFASESFWILFNIPKIILKLYLDGKLQVTFSYYFSYKRDFSYCQTLWILKWFVPLTRCQTLYMWKYDSSSNSYSSSKF